MWMNADKMWAEGNGRERKKGKRREETEREKIFFLLHLLNEMNEALKPVLCPIQESNLPFFYSPSLFLFSFFFLLFPSATQTCMHKKYFLLCFFLLSTIPFPPSYVSRFILASSFFVRLVLSGLWLLSSQFCFSKMFASLLC